MVIVMNDASFEGDVMLVNVGEGLMDYEIVEREIDTPIKCLSWLDHIGQKTWATKQTLLAIVNHAARKNSWSLHPVGCNRVCKVSSFAEAERVTGKMFDEVASVFGDIIGKAGDRAALERHIATQLKCQAVSIFQEALRNSERISESSQ